METLYTVVTREDKYKAKSVIDTFIYRAGDQLGAWGYAGLGLLGLGLTAIAWVAVPLSALFAMLAVWLGRREGEMSRRVAEEETRMPSAELEAVAST
jgi:AAA family ATP:ADP antiporter